MDDTPSPPTADLWSVEPDASLVAPPRLVPIGDVEAELGRLWTSAEPELESASPTRAAILNLVVLCSSPSAADEAQQVVRLLAGSHPSRTFVTVAQPGQTQASLQAWVSARCALQPGGGRQVCCEEVLVSASGDALEFLPHAVSSLFLPDLPSFLWVPTFREEDSGLVKSFSAVCDKIIWDADALYSPAHALPLLGRLRAEMPDTPTGDLAWIRTAPLRQKLSEHIAKDGLDPNSIHGVRISCAPESLGGALLTAGWLASALGWQARPCARGGPELVLTAQRSGPGATVEISIACSQGASASVVILGPTELAVTEPTPVFSSGRGASDADKAAETASLLCLALESHAREPALDRALKQAASMLSSAGEDQ